MDTFVDEHPGGAKILKRVGGKDASKQFWKVGRVHHVDNRPSAADTVLVSQRERVEEVCAQVKGRYCQGGSETVEVAIQMFGNTL